MKLLQQQIESLVGQYGFHLVLAALMRHAPLELQDLVSSWMGGEK